MINLKDMIKFWQISIKIGKAEKSYTHISKRDDDFKGNCGSDREDNIKTDLEKIIVNMMNSTECGRNLVNVSTFYRDTELSSSTI